MDFLGEQSTGKPHIELMNHRECLNQVQIVTKSCANKKSQHDAKASYKELSFYDEVKNLRLFILFHTEIFV